MSVDLVVKHATHMLHFMLSPVVPLHIFPRYLINGTIFEKKKTENKMCVLSFCTLFVGNFSHYKKNSATFYHKLHMSSCKVSIFLVKFLWNLNLLAKFKKNTQIPSFTKISSGGVELFHADGHTDMTKLFTVLRTRLKTQFLSSSWNFLSI